jgi:hypothetical protein
MKLLNTLVPISGFFRNDLLGIPKLQMQSLQDYFAYYMAGIFAPAPTVAPTPAPTVSVPPTAAPTPFPQSTATRISFSQIGSSNTICM